MAILSDGALHYKVNMERKKDLGYVTSVEINGRVLYDFNPNTRVLQISMSPDDLGFLLEKMGELPAEGKDLTFPSPADRRVQFKGVKKLESLTDPKEEGYMLRLYSKDKQTNE